MKQCFLSVYNSLNVGLRDAYEAFYMMFLNKIMKHLMRKRPSYNKKNRISICAIFKDEAPFLKEWIEFHKMIGVEHFYLYNNNSTDGYNEVLSPYIKDGLVTMIDWPYDQAQIRAYLHFYQNYRQETQWVAFLDIDEYLVPSKDAMLTEWLKKWDRFPSLLICWKMFGTSGKMEHDFNKLTIEQYHVCWDGFYSTGKCLVNTDYDLVMPDGDRTNIHHFAMVRYRSLFFSIVLCPMNNLGNFVRPGSKMNERTLLGKSDIQLNHYWSRAWDVYDAKRRKGDVFFDENPRSNIEYFYWHEQQNISSDYTAFRYVMRLKLQMQEI